MHGKYASLTRYLPEFEKGDFGTVPEEPRIGDVFRFSGWVNDFLADYSALAEKYDKADLHAYSRYTPEELSPDKAEDFTEVEAMATIMACIRAERFCDGALSDSFRNGLIEGCVRALERADREAAAKRPFPFLHRNEAPEGESKP